MTSPDPLAQALAGAAVAVVRPGDTLVIAFSRPLGADEARALPDMFRPAIPESVHICLIDQVSGMAVVRSESGV
jgi:hypothetical protein